MSRGPDVRWKISRKLKELWTVEWSTQSAVNRLSLLFPNYAFQIEKTKQPCKTGEMVFKYGLDYIKATHVLPAKSKKFKRDEDTLRNNRLKVATDNTESESSPTPRKNTLWIAYRGGVMSPIAVNFRARIAAILKTLVIDKIPVEEAVDRLSDYFPSYSFWVGEPPLRREESICSYGKHYIKFKKQRTHVDAEDTLRNNRLKAEAKNQRDCVACVFSLAKAIQQAGGGLNEDILKMTVEDFIMNVAGQNGIRFVFVPPDKSNET